jgi:hypothetical protein
MTPNAPAQDATGEHSSDGSDGMRTLAADAGERVSDAVGALRATADQVGERIPVVVETVRGGALESARTIEAMPESSQRLLAAFSLGLGLGLSITGAPRLVVAATLAPAMFVAAMIIGRDGSTVGRA